MNRKMILIPIIVIVCIIVFFVIVLNLGHKLNNVTEDIYINPTDEELVEAVNQIDLENLK